MHLPCAQGERSPRPLALSPATQPRPMPQRLALEIYRLIIEQVDDTTDLLSLALCCSTFRAEAQRCLFRHVKAKSFHRYMPFIAAINASSLRLGPLVHALEFVAQPGFNMTGWREAWMAPLTLALREMHNLQHLTIDRVHPSTFLHDCTFKLRTLSFGHLFKLHTMEVLFLLRDFLPTQPSLKRLQLVHSASFDVAKVPTNLCPNLDLLGAGNECFVNAILRDTRLITRFEWYLLETPPPLSIKQLNHLEYLLLKIYHPDMDASFTLNLTSLVHLELHVKLSIPGVPSHKVC
jgi:hypothetical protein